MTNATDKTATFVKQRNASGEGRVYRLDPPLIYGEREDVDGEYREVEHSAEHVWVSAVNVPYSGPETYIFASDAFGEVTSWSELPGSFKGGLDHERALHGAGYEVTR